MTDLVTPLKPANITNGMSLIIPSWNNLSYLKASIESIRKYSKYPHQIIVYVNDGSDGTRKWLISKEAQSLISNWLHSRENIGVCKAVNQARGLATKSMIGFVNDDMIFLPGWDSELAQFVDIHKIPKLSWLSCTPIEPYGKNPCCIAPCNYGVTIQQFQEQCILRDLPMLQKAKPHMVSTWAPSFWYKDTFDAVHGFSEVFSPGRGHDPDFAMKLFEIGCRHFVGVGGSLVYHFGSKTIRKVHQSNSNIIFEKKWGMSISAFVNDVLRRGSSWQTV